MEDQTSPLFLLYSIAVVQLLLLILIYHKKIKSSVSQKVIWFCLMGTLSYLITDFLLIWSGYIIHLPHLLGLSFPFYFLLGPLLFALAQLNRNNGTDQNNKLNKGLLLLHLVPFIVVFAYQLPMISLSAASKMQIYKESVVTESAFQSMTYVAEVGLLAIHLLAYSAWFFLKRKEEQNDKLSILKLIAMIFGIGGGLLIVHAILLYRSLPFYALTYCFFIGSLGMLAFWLQWMFLFPKAATTIHKYQNSGLPPSVLNREGNRILEIMEEKRPFLNADLRLGQLALMSELSTHHLSQILNQELGQSFSDFVNRYRIDHAKNLLKTESDKTIQEISYESGFNSKNSFHRSFKKFVAQTPSEFRNQG